jgi:hypothetical protein
VPGYFNVTLTYSNSTVNVGRDVIKKILAKYHHLREDDIPTFVK